MDKWMNILLDMDDMWEKNAKSFDINTESY